MPRNQGTSRKGKPKKGERAAGMGRSLQKSQQGRYRPKSNGASRGGGGMAMVPGMTNVGVFENDTNNKTKSVLELDDLSDFLTQASMAGREFESQKEGQVVLDATSTAYDPTAPRVSWQDESQVVPSTFLFSELSVPRRPAWNKGTTPQELDQLEKEAFLEWRRGIAKQEEVLMHQQQHSHVTVTPFEKNLEVWRQLWRVLERCACLVQIVDGRNPLFYLSLDLKKYCTEELQKPMVLLINKSDFLTEKQRQAWSTYLTKEGWNHVFFSAHDEQHKLNELAAIERRKQEKYGELESESFEKEQEFQSPQDKQDSRSTATAIPEEEDSIGVSSLLSREQLLDWLHQFAIDHGLQPDARHKDRIQFGMVGFPNVGKSSVINVLMGNAKHQHGVTRVGVASQPGKTKHFQTLLLPQNSTIMLCDCPGLVFPSFCSSTADLIAAGVYPIAQMRDYWPVVELVCKRIPRRVLEAHYGIVLPTRTQVELKEGGYTKEQLPPPTAEELLTTYCVARSMLAASSGVPDHQRASRIVIKDYAEGKLLYCHAPPPPTDGGDATETDYYRETLLTSLKNTKKLRDKLAPNLLVESSRAQEHVADKDATATDTVDLGGLEDDLDLLDMVGSGMNNSKSSSTSSNGNKRGKKHKTMHKHGKKGRKDRNKDPYGCHSDPNDVLLMGSSAASPSSGVIVKAGKYGRRGYTRPNYAGVRNAVQYVSEE